jgi:Dolichyl-phosphate-mannose-protein mannosyltransferase
MPVETLTLNPRSSSRSEGKQTRLRDYLARLSEPLGPRAPWNRTTYIAFLTLVILWAARVYTTWATWGDLSIDSGHEMYVPVVLSEGKMLYRDIWYMHGPFAPYFNSLLFRLMGVHLNVLYWAGSLTALACALILYIIGMELSSWVIGWTVGAVMLIQAFHPFIFNFALPYSFDSAYGLLAACLFIWFEIRAVRTQRGWWTFGAGIAAAVALLCKVEMGVACYSVLSLVMVTRLLMQRSWKEVMIDVLSVLPGVVVCIGVARWMISIKDMTFITEENIISWPGTYYMKTYGKQWLEFTGFALNGSSFAGAALRTALVALVLLLFYRFLHRLPPRANSSFLRLGAFVAGLALLAYVLPSQAELAFDRIFFPQDMVFYVGVAALIAWCHFLLQPSRHDPSVALLLMFSAVFAFRILFGMQPSGYPIFYTGPVLLAYLLLALALVPREGREPEFIFKAECLICFACLSAVILHTAVVLPSTKDYVPLATERGMIRVPKEKADAYRVAIAFMNEKTAHGEAVLSLPEDTSLYFFSETHCPTRLWAFGPGTLAPGRMTDEFLAQMEHTPVQYLLWSNRTYAETGAPNFGVDFDIPLGNYIASHYKFVRPLMPAGSGGWMWNAGIWERKP